MRSRITVAILATLAAALVLTGLGTLVLDRVAARADTETELRSQAAGLAELLAPTAVKNGSLQRPVVNRLLKGFKLEGIGLVFLGPGGAVYGTPPEGIEIGSAEVASLQAGEILSGHNGRLVYAIAPAEAARGTLVAVLTREVSRSPGPAFQWFAISAVIVLGVGTLVSIWLSRALTDPLRRAELATRQIAAGDLQARVPEGLGGGTELVELGRSINSMAESLERSRALEQQFLLSVSHDLRTPLTSIRGYAEAINDGTAPDATGAAAVILAESGRLERLVRDLLDLARLDAREFSLHSRPVPVGELVMRTAEGFRRQATEAGVQLDLSGQPTTSVATIDPDRLAQVIANLMENGLKYARTRLFVGAADSGDVVESVEIVVTDDGPGIDPADLPHVFERLYVAALRPVRAEVGSGLGLAIVHELVAAMGGRVTVESPIAPDGGTRFVVSIPLGRM